METRSSSHFQKQLGFGRVAESQIASLIMRKGGTVIPVYEQEVDSGKGPQIFKATGNLISPDMIVFRQGKCLFVEAKHKTHFSWGWKKKKWQTGIDGRHWEDYKKVKIHFGFALWIMFLHINSIPHKRDIERGCPEECPTGLFGGEIDDLQQSYSHTSGRHGASGMIYWNIEALTRFCSLEDVRIGDGEFPLCGNGLQK